MGKSPTPLSSKGRKRRRKGSKVPALLTEEKKKQKISKPLKRRGPAKIVKKALV